jgi:hypothetical protein
MEDLFNKYVSPPDPFCKRSQAAGQNTQIGFHDVMGLWVLLAGGIAVALLTIMIGKLMARSANQVKRAASLVRQFSQTQMRRLPSLTTRPSLKGGEEGKRAAAAAAAVAAERAKCGDDLEGGSSGSDLGAGAKSVGSSGRGSFRRASFAEDVSTPRSDDKGSASGDASGSDAPTRESEILAAMERLEALLKQR